MSIASSPSHMKPGTELGAVDVCSKLKQCGAWESTQDWPVFSFCFDNNPRSVTRQVTEWWLSVSSSVKSRNWFHLGSQNEAESGQQFCHVCCMPRVLHPISSAWLVTSPGLAHLKVFTEIMQCSFPQVKNKQGGIVPFPFPPLWPAFRSPLWGLHFCSSLICRGSSSQSI